MNLSYKHLINSGFAPQSRVWIYQASRLLSIQEALEAEQLIHSFVHSWVSHTVDVKADGLLLFGRFIILMADETHTTVSGCSTDSSVRFIQQLERNFNIQLFNRKALAFVIKDKIEVIPYEQVEYALQNGFISPQTFYFNNLASTKKELEENWIIPVSKSWLANKLPMLT